MTTHSKVRLLESSIGEWKVEEWCYFSFGDGYDWGRPHYFKHKWLAKRYMDKRVKELEDYEIRHNVIWVVISEV